MRETIKTDKFGWFHFSENADADILKLEETHGFHHLDIEDITSGPQQPKIDFYKSYLFGIFHFPDYVASAKRIHVMELDIFLGADYIITISKGSDSRIQSLRKQLKDDAEMFKEFTEQGAAFFMYSVIDWLTEQCWPVVRRMSTQLNDVEEAIYSEEKRKQTLWQLALIRRNLIRISRIINPQLIAVKTLASSNRGYVPESLSIYFDDIADTLSRMQAITGGHAEVINSLHNVNESLISQRTNDVIKVLTVISVSLMPLTLLTGFYGMNILNLPYANHPDAIWLVFGGVFVFIVLILYYFHKRDWL